MKKLLLRNVFYCGDDREYSYVVKVFYKGGRYDFKKDFFESMVSKEKEEWEEKVIRKTDTKEINGFKVLEYYEDEYITVSGKEKLRGEKIYKDFYFKTNSEAYIETTVWCARQGKTSDWSFTPCKHQLENFYQSLKITPISKGN